MRRSISVAVVVGCVLCAGCGRSTSSTAVTVSLAVDSPAPRTLTYRIWNNSDRPIILQLQPQSGVGYYLQSWHMRDNVRPTRGIPVGRNLGSGTKVLAAGRTMDFDLVGEAPGAFRVGVMSSLSRESGGQPWWLIWSPWCDDRTGSEPAAAGG